MESLAASVAAILKAALYDSRQYVFYQHDPDRQGLGCLDPRVTEYTDYSRMPTFIRKAALRNFLVNPMYYRLRRHQARLLCMHDGVETIGYGWLQSWQPFRRRLGWMCNRATVLGPYWVDPRHRRKGIYSGLLRHSLAVADKQWPILIYTTPDNLASRKGIVNAGFRLVGTYEIRRIRHFFERHRELAHGVDGLPES